MPNVNTQTLSWARETAGLSLSDAAERLSLEVPPGSSAVDRLAAIESGHVQVSRAVLLRMAQCYRQPLGTFYRSSIPRKERPGRDQDVSETVPVEIPNATAVSSAPLCTDGVPVEEPGTEVLASDVPDRNVEGGRVSGRRARRAKPAFTGARLLFVLSVLATALTVWMAADQYHEGSLLKVQHALNQALIQRDDYRVKLHGALPDEAARKIAQLEDELAVLQTSSIVRDQIWQPLTQVQIEKSAEVLRRYPVTSIDVLFLNQYSADFRRGLDEVFRRALWPAPATNPAYGTGIVVRSRPDEGPAFALVSLLKNLGYPVSHVTEGERSRGKIRVDILNKPH